MTSKQAPPRSTPAAESQHGLSADELQAEQAGDLPEREAMSILDVGGLHVGLPTPGDLDGVLNTPDPLNGQPIGGVVDPVAGGDHIPVDQPVHIPVDQPVQIPVDQPVQTLTGDVGNPPTDGGLIGIPELPLDAETTA